MNNLQISKDFTIEDIHKIREWNHKQRKIGKIEESENMLKIIEKFPKAKYVRLKEYVAENTHITTPST